MISPRTPGQDGKTVWQEPHEVQQGEVQNPASGEKQCQAPVYAGDTQLHSISLMQEGWESWDYSEGRKGSYGGILPVCTNTWKEGARKIKLGSSHPHPLTGLEIKGTNWNTGGSPPTSRNTFSLWGRLSTDTDFSERLWNPWPWRYLKVTRTQSLATSCRWPCLSRRIGPDDLQVLSKLSPSVILWSLPLMYHSKVSETLSGVQEKNISGKKKGC